MSSIAFWNYRKKIKRTPHVLFQLKDPNTLIFRLKYITNNADFKNYKKISRYEYQIKREDLQKVVDICDRYRWEVIPFPNTVQKALDLSIDLPFKESFEQTHLWDCMFDYQKEGVKHVIKHLSGRALIGDEMGLGKTLQAISVYKYYDIQKLLEICPAYLRYTWKHELEKWVPGIESSVILTGKDLSLIHI